MQNSKQARAENLFSKMKISKAIWIVAIPGLLGALMIGLYSFVDQLLIQQFVPSTKIIFDTKLGLGDGEINSFLAKGIANITNQQFVNLINSYNTLITSDIASVTPKLTNITANSIVSTSTVAFNPLIIFANAIVFLIPVGASVYYTKMISKGYEKTGKDLWATVFYTSLGLALVASLGLIIAASSGLIGVIAGANTFNDALVNKMNLTHSFNGNIGDGEIMVAYFNAANKMSVWWAQQYTYIYAGGTFIMALYTLLSFLIRAEGKNNYVMFFAIIANVANIALDALFIIVFKMGVLGGAVATIIGWIINLGGYLWYCFYNTKKKSTWLDLKHLTRFKFRTKILFPITMLGFSGFARSFTIAIAIFFISFIFINAPYADAVHFQYFWSKSNPVLLLFLFGMFGVVDGARSLVSYNYSRRDFKRCKQVFWWSLLITLIYGSVSFILMFFGAPLFTMLLNVEPDKLAGTTRFLKILSLRLLFFVPIIMALLVFQGTNNIKMSTITAISESVIFFSVIMTGAYFVGLQIYNNGWGTTNANFAILWGYIIDTIVAGLTMLGIATYNLYRVLPKVDQGKLNFSRRLEHQFFEQAEKYEQEHNQEEQQNLKVQ